MFDVKGQRRIGVKAQYYCGFRAIGHFLARAANPFPLFAMISIGNGLLVWIGMMLFRGPELLSGLRKIFWI